MIVRTPGPKLQASRLLSPVVSRRRVSGGLKREPYRRLVLTEKRSRQGGEHMLAEERLHLDPTRSCSLQSLCLIRTGVNEGVPKVSEGPTKAFLARGIRNPMGDRPNQSIGLRRLNS